VVSGATVVVQDVDKNLSRTFITDKAGLFETGPIVPDHYLVTVSAPGFKTVIRGPITLEVGTDTLNAELTVGEAHEQVVVTTDLPLLETESGSQTEALEANTMAELPQYGSDWQNFVFMVPGAQFSYRTGQTAEINGNLPYNSVLADGATTTLPMSSNSDVTIFEATSEVKVDSNAFSAQYGLGGIIFNQISKGGGDKFHGSAYEYFQNDALNAADFSITGGKNKVAFQRYDNYGFSISGPVLIPHTKIGKNVFFFFDYDRTYSNGGSGNTVLSVPTDAMKQGDFTGLPTIFDYKTQQLSWVQDPSSGAWVPDTVRESFADEYGNGNKLPSSYFSPLMLEFQKFFPEPNVTSGTITSANGMPHNNYTTNVPNLGPFIKYFGRLDYTPTANHRFTISETSSDNPAISYGYGKALCPINCQSQDVSRDNAQVSDVWTINANMVNEARMGFTDQLNFFSPFSQAQGYPEKMGIKWAVADAIPPVDLMSLSSLSEPSNSVYKEFVFDPSDVFTLVHGRHVLHFGGEFLISRADSTAWGNENPGETYFGGYYSDGCIVDSCKWNMSSINQQNNDDAEYSDFLQGLSAMWWGNFTPEFGARIKNPQAFVQDDMKLRPNLTLNLGLRWFGTTGFNEVKGHMAAFDPTVVNGGSGNDPNGNPAASQLGGIWYGFSHANGRTTLQAPVWDTFLPRIGVSWSVNSKTVVRGGFGLYNYSWSEDTYGAGMGGGAGGSGGAWDPSNGIYYQLQMDADGSINYEGPQNGSQGCTTGCWGKSVQGLWVVNPTTPYAQNGNGASYNQYHTPVPKIWQYNLTVERQIGATMKAQAAYVGSMGSNLNFGVDINQVPASELSATDTAPGSNKRPFPLFTGLGGSTNNAVSAYNSLQMVFSKRLSYGLVVDANYTWSKFLDSMDSAGWGSSVGTQNYQNSYCVKCNWGPSNFDQRHVLSASAIYTLPFGRGAQFLNNNAIVDEIIGGWRLAATTRDNSGSPFTPTMATNTSYSQAGALYPNLIGDPNQMVTPRSIHNWYNKDAFGAPAVATFGNAHRNSVYGPSYYNLNMSFGKTFNIAEKAKFEIRADAQNALNHPILGSPDSGIGDNNPSELTGVIDGGRHIQLYGKFTF